MDVTTGPFALERWDAQRWLPAPAQPRYEPHPALKNGDGPPRVVGAFRRLAGLYQRAEQGVSPSLQAELDEQRATIERMIRDAEVRW